MDRKAKEREKKKYYTKGEPHRTVNSQFGVLLGNQKRCPFKTLQGLSTAGNNQPAWRRSSCLFLGTKPDQIFQTIEGGGIDIGQRLKVSP